ncbi:MAG TPA: cytochrome c3 family protein [Steroidobacteraceae bacterium]|nr:cytochrome c3 family protein [Steroidobacteraceae bacterium]
MAQIFSRRFGTLLKLTLVVGAVLFTGSVLSWRALTADPHAMGEPVEQPVPFSHKHHVGDVGLDCRYCHASVETDAVAGIPPISTCMTCHSELFTDQAILAPLVRSWQTRKPLLWQRIYDLPDFVYFDHSIHIAKGIGCVSCHGRVDRMPLMARQASLSMHWCLDCHRNPEKFLRPRSQVFSMDWSPQDQSTLGESLLARYHIDKRRLTDCSVCHR